MAEIRPRRGLATLGILVGLALGALDATIVGPALPRIVASLQGVELYFLVTSAFLVTSTSTMPVWGRLLDLHGRRPFHLAGIVLFVGGSALCGASQSMTQLVAFRAVQGLGAGALLPASFTMIADLYPLEERGKMQGLVAGVWGLSAVVGPPLGALITQALGWRWVFYVNVPIGLAAAALVLATWREPERAPGRRKIDVWGASHTLAAAGFFMAGCALLNRTGAGGATLACFGVSLIAAVLLVLTERRAADPFIVHELFRIRIFSAGLACGACAAIGLFCVTTYVTLHMQAVLGSTVLESGLVLLPMTVGWILVTGLASRFCLRIGYRGLALAGMAMIVAGFSMILLMGGAGTWTRVAVALTITGAGTGSVMTPLLIAAQNAVAKEKLGAATSLTQFSRSMAGAVGVAVMGVLLASTMAPRVPPGLRPDDVLNPMKLQALAPEALAALRGAVAAGMHNVFLVGLGAGVVGLFCALLVPGGSGRDLAFQSPVPGPRPPVEGG